MEKSNTNNTHIEWKKLNDFWWQKITIIDDSFPLFEYHYKSKTGKVCTALQIDTKISKQYCGYCLIEKDLRDCLNFLEDYRKHYTFENSLLIKGLVRLISITYAKCFTKAEGRKVSLNESIIPDEYIQSHKYLMKMRNKYVAHAGISEHESCKFIILVPPKNKYIKGKTVVSLSFTELYQTISKKKFLDEKKPLIEFLHNKAAEKISSLRNKIENEINLSPDKFYNFIKNKKLLINEKDF